MGSREFGGGGGLGELSLTAHGGGTTSGIARLYQSTGVMLPGWGNSRTIASLSKEGDTM